MDRNEFIKRCTALGLGASVLPYMLTSCSSSENPLFGEFEVNFSGKVLVIGAGAAGMIAGHVLNKHNIDFEIIEASSGFGGRVREIQGFADFPIDLGAEWIHDEPSILARLLSDPNVDEDIELINYAPETFYLWKDGKLRKRNFFSNFYAEYKFKSTTWYDFFNRFIVPGISDRMVFDSPITSIDYSADQIVVTNLAGRTFEGDKLILTVPLTILKQNLINFTPALPQFKTDALDGVEMPDGLKAFFEFSERFYPDILFQDGIFEFLSEEFDSKVFYDAAFRKDSNRNVLGLFTVGDPSSTYTNLPSDDAIFQFIMEELDTMFDGKASRYYQNHVIQNWSSEPFIRGSYSNFIEDVIEDLRAPINNKIFFAGEAYAPDDITSTVHGAGISAYNVVETILQD